MPGPPGGENFRAFGEPEALSVRAVEIVHRKLDRRKGEGFRVFRLIPVDQGVVDVSFDGVQSGIVGRLRIVSVLGGGGIVLQEGQECCDIVFRIGHRFLMNWCVKPVNREIGIELGVLGNSLSIEVGKEFISHIAG